jgi:UDP-galactopyranose mutase
VPYTRIIEHKHFEFGNQPTTIITKEYPQTWQKGMEPYYPVNDQKNETLFKQYQILGDAEKQVYFGGRLAEYRYYDMHQIVASARVKVANVIAEMDQK